VRGLKSSSTWVVLLRSALEAVSTLSWFRGTLRTFYLAGLGLDWNKNTTSRLEYCLSRAWSPLARSSSGGGGPVGGMFFRLVSH
jgi:hypothetical protein